MLVSSQYYIDYIAHATNGNGLYWSRFGLPFNKNLALIKWKCRPTKQQKNEAKKAVIDRNMRIYKTKLEY